MFNSNTGNDPYMGSCTFTIFTNVTPERARHIIADFRDYERAIGEVTVKEDTKTPGKYNILYRSWKGITWSVGAPYDYAGRRFCKIDAHINPKVFTGIDEIYKILHVDYLKSAGTVFDAEVRKVSSALKDFSAFKLGRIRYYIDFDLEKLNCQCSSEQMMTLLNQGNVPFVYDEYRNKYGQEKSDSDKKYMDFHNPENESVVVSIYRKYAQRKNGNRRSYGGGYGGKGYSGNSYGGNGYNNQGHNSQDPATSSNSIRFEVNYNYRNSPAMEQLLTENSGFTSFMLDMMFSRNACHGIIYDYFDWTIMHSDYYSLDRAVKLVKERAGNEKRAERLADTLKLIRDYNGITRAKERLSGEALADFYSRLRELKGLNINPVTIPDEFSVPFVQNLMDGVVNGARKKY